MNPETQSPPQVTVCIVTRNRKDDVLKAIESALAQNYPALEVRVYDNGSTDGTWESIQSTFPAVAVTREKENAGAAKQRNRCFRESAAKYIFSMDDDSYFTDPDTVGAAVAVIESHQDVAVLAMPFVEPAQRGMRTWTPPADPDNLGVPVRSFVACACLLRRDAVIAAKGYREFFEQWGEERDLSIRLMNRGFSILFARTPPLVHVGSMIRDRGKMEELGVRNTILFDWLNLPALVVVPRLFADAVRLFAHKLSLKNLAARAGYVMRGFLYAVRMSGNRSAVSRNTYRRYRILPGHGPLSAPQNLPPPLRRNITT